MSAQARAAARSRLHAAGRAQADDGRVLAPFGRRRCEVVGNRTSGGYRIFAALDTDGPLPRAGQFYMLATVAGWSGEDARPYLPRAFSIARAEAVERGVRLEFLVEGVGPGSKRLATLDTGEELWVTGPLGRPFPAPHEIDQGLSGAILVGGGIGVAPLAILRGELARAGIPSRTVLGFRDRAHAGGLDLFDCSEIRLASEDGHVGHRGFVTDLLAVLLEGDAAGGAAAYACGPPAMLEAVRLMCAERDMAAELALETPMACGYGACFGCAVPLVAGGYLRLCIDGPVVPADRIASAMVPGSGHR